VYIYK